jgi:glycosyltransferase involved in cell wall biosynthesis
MKIPSYSITIQTYVHRFEPYFKPLLARVHKQRPNIEKLVFVNGQHKEKFDETYRREMLQYASYFSNTFLLMSPIVRGCSFMWNNSINYTSGKYVLVLSDDVIILDGFFDEFEAMLAKNHELGDESFRINYHWGHFCIYRQDVLDKDNRVGYFDERLIGFGEEDGDWMWRYQDRYNRHMRNYLTDKLPYNTDEKCLPGKNTRPLKLGDKDSKYSAFNREFMESKMENDPNGTNNGCGIHRDYTPRLKAGMEIVQDLYPGERWYRENIHRL